MSGSSGSSSCQTVRINRLECVERVVEASDEGTAIRRTFYLDPYEAHPFVLSALLGAIENGQRRLPAHDPYWADCYCTDATVKQVDQATMAWSPGLGMKRGDASSADIVAALQGKEVPTGPASTVTEQGSTSGVTVTNAGCLIQSVFRPLVHEAPGWAVGSGGYFGLSWSNFDFVDPQLHPITKTASTGTSLRYLVTGALSTNRFAKVGAEGFITQPMQQFTIRRIMVPRIPATTISKFKGHINAQEFTIGNFTFAPETLRFDDCEVIKRAVPYCDGSFNLWYDLLYMFTWNTIYDEYWATTNYETGEGQFAGPGYVGWNRIFGAPADMLGLRMVIPGSVNQFPNSYYPVGWKSTILGTYRGLYPDDTLNNDANYPYGFHHLFDLNAP